MREGPEREARRRRAEFRAFVRAHHPDVGGDPAEFAAGIARFRGGDGQPGAGGPPDEARAPADRFDAPVVFVSRRAGLTGIAARFRRWRRRRRRPPRVS
ncbi:hypothetical protein B0I33_101487 [Prauserella shujinwangii]|uniref:J domain-containing protein n=1 Tax=Prauserella shujinwangii TaxID=1453103 RepID=A0A2T0M3K9_9PSEU|nr:hypothetical protein [Prauserella shujinwangii]PRX51334.1 hypothetical protein B0I33_101487 [Prauserella shujinwangii]